MKKALFFLFFSSTLLVSCKPKAQVQEAAPQTPQVAETPQPIAPKKAIMVGLGGGFTGKYQEYLLHENGQVESKDFGQDAFKPTKKLGPELTKELFDRAESLQLNTINVSNPGNMTRYLEWRVDDLYHRITWGGGQANPGAEVEKFFEAVQRAVH